MDFIIILVLILIMFIAIKSTIKHLKGNGGCCGGGHTPIVYDKILDEPIVRRVTIKIEDMKCEACVAHIKQALNKLDGVSATVSLFNKEANVEMSTDVSNEILIKTINKAGYQVNSIIDY